VSRCASMLVDEPSSSLPAIDRVSGYPTWLRLYSLVERWQTENSPILATCYFIDCLRWTVPRRCRLPGAFYSIAGIHNKFVFKSAMG
jgi:hypothetical protein